MMKKLINHDATYRAYSASEHNNIDISCTDLTVSERYPRLVTFHSQIKLSAGFRPCALVIQRSEDYEVIS